MTTPTHEVFSTPPTTPHSHQASHTLTPSLSRKTSRPSSLRIERSTSAEYHPDIVLTEESLSPEALKTKSPESAKSHGTPRAAESSLPLKSARLQHLSQQEPLEPPKSPYFVHSHLDRGVSLTDWLRTNGPNPMREGTPNGVTIATEMGNSPANEVFERDDDEEDYSQASLTRQLAETAVGVREMSKQLGRARIHSNIQNILIVTKAQDNRLIKLTRDISLYLMTRPRKGNGRGLVVYVDQQLRKSRRFDVAGMQKEHPHLFQPLPRRRSTASFSSESSYENVTNAEGPSEAGQLRYWTNEMCSRSPHLFDFVITLGGDGTVLYTSWLFQRIVPPVLPFALGSLGFLTNFDFADHVSVMDNALESGIRVNLRMRFTCTVFRAVSASERKKKGSKKLRAVKKAETGEIMMQNIERGGWEAIEGNAPENYCMVEDKEITCFSTRPAETFEILNDLVVDRGPSPYVSQLELFADEHHLTTVQADGLCVATPTGSTAYSLSAGGSLAHPEIPAILITPLCPHTLSFRPMLLPDNQELRICVPFDSRSTAWASFDGRGRVELKQGDHIKVTASMYPFPTVCADRASTDWFSSISRTLKWNERERQKSFVVIEENPAIAKVAKQQAKAEVAAAKDQDQAEEDEVSDEEDDGFDIDVIDDSSSATSLSTDSQELSPSVKAAQEVMLQPGESAIGRQKTKEQAYEQAHQQAHAEAAAHALSEGFPSSGSQSSTNHNQSGIQSPSRFLGPHPSAPPTARHVAFSNTSAPSSASHLHSPRAVKPGDSGRYDDREGLKTPTAAEIRKGNGPTQKVGRSRSAEARHHHPRAFAAWGQDGSESESNASEDEN